MQTGHRENGKERFRQILLKLLGYKEFVFL
jgi:hypothetical protein